MSILKNVTKLQAFKISLIVMTVLFMFKCTQSCNRGMKLDRMEQTVADTTATYVKIISQKDSIINVQSDDIKDRDYKIKDLTNLLDVVKKSNTDLVVSLKRPTIVNVNNENQK